MARKKNWRLRTSTTLLPRRKLLKRFSPNLDTYSNWFLVPENTYYAQPFSSESLGPFVQDGACCKRAKTEAPARLDGRASTTYMMSCTENGLWSIASENLSFNGKRHRGKSHRDNTYLWIFPGPRPTG